MESEAEKLLREFVNVYANVGNKTWDERQVALYRVWLRTTKLLKIQPGPEPKEKEAH